MNKEIELKIGQNIKQAREAIKMTQDVLAAKLQLKGCDITRSAIAKIEVGQRHLYPDEIILLKEILCTDFNTLFYGKEETVLPSKKQLADNVAYAIPPITSVNINLNIII